MTVVRQKKSGRSNSQRGSKNKKNDASVSNIESQVPRDDEDSGAPRNRRSLLIAAINKSRLAAFPKIGEIYLRDEDPSSEVDQLFRMIAELLIAFEHWGTNIDGYLPEGYDREQLLELGVFPKEEGTVSAEHVKLFAASRDPYAKASTNFNSMVTQLEKINGAICGVPNNVLDRRTDVALVVLRMLETYLREHSVRDQTTGEVYSRELKHLSHGAAAAALRIERDAVKKQRRAAKRNNE